uniref:Aminoacyl-tRNA synthetase class II (D/K/N) domain-containing protein n=1 Tax=Aegilops tauschii subsp. strangulata TaxID=200361 RepID=A0A453G906_AEGTS
MLMFVTFMWHLIQIDFIMYFCIMHVYFLLLVHKCHDCWIHMQKFIEFLFSENFIGIHSPKLIGGSREGGAFAFKLEYNGQSTCLA